MKSQNLRETSKHYKNNKEKVFWRWPNLKITLRFWRRTYTENDCYYKATESYMQMGVGRGGVLPPLIGDQARHPSRQTEVLPSHGQLPCYPISKLPSYQFNPPPSHQQNYVPPSLAGRPLCIYATHEDETNAWQLN